jgi:hypothetical protein
MLSDMDACNHIDELDLEEAGDAICSNKKRRLKMAILRVNQRKLKLVNCLSRVKYYNQARYELIFHIKFFYYLSLLYFNQFHTLVSPKPYFYMILHFIQNI